MRMEHTTARLAGRECRRVILFKNTLFCLPFQKRQSIAKTSTSKFEEKLLLQIFHKKAAKLSFRKNRK
jgi:hypothetical protein